MNDIFAHRSLIFLPSWLQIFQLCLSSELHPFIWFFFKNSFRKKKNIQKTIQNVLAPSIFIGFSIVLKLGTPLLQRARASKNVKIWSQPGNVLKLGKKQTTFFEAHGLIPNEPAVVSTRAQSVSFAVVHVIVWRTDWLHSALPRSS